MTDPIMSESPPTPTVAPTVAPTVMVRNVSPTPTDAEVVAIVAGVEALWPRPLAVADAAPDRSTNWRFSGRWWSRPVPARRDRPFR